MRVAILFLTAVLLWTGVSQGRSDPDPRLKVQAPLPGELIDDHPRSTVATRADTMWFGDFEVIDGEYYARSSPYKEDVLWTFDRGNGPFGDPNRLENGAGWAAGNPLFAGDFSFSVIDTTLDLGDDVPAPIISGMQSLWIGVDRPQANALCYECGAGYGNDWRQRVISEPLAYNGTGDVTLRFLYFSNAESCFDGTQIYLVREDDSELFLNPYPGYCESNPSYVGGSFTDSIGSYDNPATYTRVITAEEIEGLQDIRFVFEFTSDGGWSDQDCDFTTTCGPFGVDDISIEGGGINSFYDFEDGLQGWTPTLDGSPWWAENQAGVTDVECYDIPDHCDCGLERNILEVHADTCNDGLHWEDMVHVLRSPICDLASSEPKDVFLELNADFCDWTSGLSYRVAWSYYPWTCEATGEETWSPRTGCPTWYGGCPECVGMRYGAMNCGVPQTAEKVIAYVEVRCQTMIEIPCWTFSPLFDNLAIGVTEAVNGPIIDFDGGTDFQDVGSHPSNLFDVRAPGPASITRNVNFGSPQAPVVLGDSLAIVGPDPIYDPNTRWEARMWWRVAKRASFQSDYEDGVETRYKVWRDRVSDGLQIDRPEDPEFTFGWMDSVQTHYVAWRHRFCSHFREDDDDFRGETFDGSNPETEMLWDDIFLPGTRIEYFVTSNYILAPDELYYLPDTSGGNFYEFEILPGVRTAHLPDCGGAGHDFCLFHPATLYIDAHNRGAQIFIENALATVLNGRPLCDREEGCPIPKDRNWDRYDYTWPDANFSAPFARSTIPGSNNGMTLSQILGYRTILLNTGTRRAGVMREEDFALFREWLTSNACDANTNRQLFLANGDAIGEVLEDLPIEGAPFLNDVLGASLLCDAFNGYPEDPDCAPVSESYCVRLLPSGAGPFGTELDVDAFGSSCPNDFHFNVLSTTGTGIGNRTYSAEDGSKDAEFAQVTNENLGTANYRTVVTAPSWDHVTRRDPGGGEMELCPRDLPTVVAGIASEIGAAMRWGFDAIDNEAIPKFANAESLGTCQETWGFPAEVGEPPADRFVTRLYQNRPNPSHAGTAIRFSLAQPAHVVVAIYDVNGRLVRTLFDGKRDAGLHTVNWDGTNDIGKSVGSGVYWSQMEAGRYTSNKKMIVLR